MSARDSDRHHAIALVPAALLLTVASAPWGGAAAPTSEPASRPGPSVPTEALEAPASVARRGAVAPRDAVALKGGVTSASATGIPDSALAAYQRAETVINAADTSCNISWQLIAAIGRVESDHGRVYGNSLNDKGLATPGIYGIPLNGSNDTAVIRDTDAGQYDSDATWDRAVGPMQFIPSTWSVVGVDGDNDGKRDPQDVDDAALATAVYLCSGNDDLSTEAGRRPAVFRYNHSHRYVDLVLSLMDAYLEGDFTSVPNATTSYASTFVPAFQPGRTAPGRASHRSEPTRSARDQQATGAGRDNDGAGPSRGGNGPSDADVVPGPPDTDEPAPDTEEPTDPTDPGEGTEEPTDPTDGTDEGTEEPTDPTDGPGDGSEEPGDPGEGTEEPTDPGESIPPTEEQATEQCLEEVGLTAADLPNLEALGLLADFTTCMTELGFPQ